MMAHTNFIKTILLPIPAFLFLSCSEPTTEKKEIHTDSTIEIKQNFDDKIDNNDSKKIIIFAEGIDTMSYTEAELSVIVKNNPEINDSLPLPPDMAYVTNGDEIRFDSEVGQDEYYILYAYFLKNKNGEKKYQSQRKNLISIFRTINGIFQKLNHGGTYYGHQYTRIIGYAEYSIYSQIDNDNYKKEYDYKPQKQIYLKSLMQIIEDELRADNDLSKTDKVAVKKELTISVNNLDKLIKNYSDLRSTVKFQNENY
ncbi:hypothetical protein BH10BAC1_BH10BAC1_13330 [soil metagenome]